MAPERWRKVESLYEAAVALAPERRARFFDESCSGDESLRHEVESLLHHDENAGRFLEDSPMATGRAVLKPGSNLGSFEILGLLGKGGMGEVYRARDSRLGREVAIKILPPEFALDAERAARFEREARATSALDHPNILTVYDIGREGDLSWIVCELVDGQSLRQALAAGPMRPQRAVEIAAQIANGLAAAHAAGVIHRDLNPGNVMLTRDERVKILDFGIAKWRPPRVTGRPDEVSTETGAILGTPSGMSPEQVSGAPVDHRSDLFSLGVLLFEMLTARRPFTGDTPIALMNSIAQGKPEDLPAEIPEGVANIVRRLLAKAPERRFQSAADLAFALRISERRQIQTTIATKWRWNKRWFAAAAAIMLALLVAAGGFYLADKRAQASRVEFSGTLRRLTWDQGLTTSAAISPDGKLVAYASDRGNQGNLDIYVQQVQGGGTVRLTNGPMDQDSPTISPDGARVAFERYGEEAGIYETAALGGPQRLLVRHGRYPRFSPDGRSLLYSIGRGSGMPGGGFPLPSEYELQT